MKILLKLILLSLLSFQLTAQQDALFSMFHKTQDYYNPASISNIENIRIAAIYRNKWIGFKGPSNEEAPQTVYSSLIIPFENKFIDGIGISYFNDEQGFEKTQMLSLKYSNSFSFSNQKICFGLKIGFGKHGINGRNWIPPTGDPDPHIPVSTHQYFADMDIGLLYSNKVFRIGLSNRHLNGAYLNRLDYQNVRSYYLHLATSEELIAFGNFKFQPHLFIKSDSAKTQIEFLNNFIYKDLIQLGLGWRQQESLYLNVGIKVFKNFELGFAYDYLITDLSKYSSGSLEGMLIYNFGK